jgi:hypothetical protein
MKFRNAAATLVSASMLAIGGAAVLATPAEAASTIQITKVYVNSAGSDFPVTNYKVNQEYTKIKNTGSSTRTLTGWTLRDKSNHVYRFGSFKLGAGKTVTVRNGNGTNTSTTRYWGSGYYIWNNTGGDAAILRTSAGTQIDKCAWSGSVATSVTC